MAIIRGPSYDHDPQEAAKALLGVMGFDVAGIQMREIGTDVHRWTVPVGPRGPPGNVKSVDAGLVPESGQPVHGVVAPTPWGWFLAVPDQAETDDELVSMILGMDLDAMSTGKNGDVA